MAKAFRGIMYKVGCFTTITTELATSRLEILMSYNQDIHTARIRAYDVNYTVTTVWLVIEVQQAFLSSSESRSSSWHPMRHAGLVACLQFGWMQREIVVRILLHTSPTSTKPFIADVLLLASVLSKVVIRIQGAPQ
jgi:hypothetical protein